VQEKPSDPTVGYSFLDRWGTAKREFSDKPLSLIREGLLLNEEAYDRVKLAPRPTRLGLSILGYIAILLLISLVFGMLLGYLTMPQLDVLSAQIYDRIVQFDWFTALAERNPQFGAQFEPAYSAVWQLIRIFGGYPSAVGFGLTAVTSLVSLFVGWLVYGATAHLFARWLGGRATFGQFLGPLALSYAPLVLRGLGYLPGLVVAVPLIFLLTLVAKFIAVRRTYELTPGYSLVVTIAPYLLGLVAGLALLALGLGFGLSRIPYLDPILRLIRIWP
jgi:hypothetical protein